MPDSSKSPRFGRAGILAFWLLSSALMVSILVNTAKNGADFHVYWKAARAVLEGGTAYSVERDGIMTFKYPPWVLPFFLPLGFLSFGAAKVLWGVLESLSLLTIILWCRRRGSGHAAILGTLLLFLPILNTHAFDGQISLLLTAICLLGWQTFSEGDRSPRSYLLTYALSVKLFTLFPVLGMRFKKDDLGRILLLLSGCGALVGVAMALDASKTEIFREWLRAAGPGTDASGQLLISPAGMQAQGWVSAVFRLTGWPADRGALVYPLVLGIACVAAVLWRKTASRLPPAQAWAGWLGLAATLQPLAGFHTFVLSLPLAVLAFARPAQGPIQGWRQVLPFVGLIALTVITEKIGHVGWMLQVVSIKSFGVLLLLISVGMDPRGGQ